MFTYIYYIWNRASLEAISKRYCICCCLNLVLARCRDVHSPSVWCESCRVDGALVSRSLFFSAQTQVRAFQVATLHPLFFLSISWICSIQFALCGNSHFSLISGTACSKHTLPDLPYDYSALEPVISAQIMQLHHQKHHATYVNNLNQFEEKSMEALAKGTHAETRPSEISAFCRGCQHCDLAASGVEVQWRGTSQSFHLLD